MITVRDLTFSYTKKPFIEGMSFSVDKGEIFGFLGPSGAGKSTLQKILTGLVPRYGGSAQINGRECKSHGADFYEEIGVDFEFSSLCEKLTARENLRFFASLYKKKPLPEDSLLDSVGLLNDADKKVREFSKGMKSRLNFIRAIQHEPSVLFLDEPTSGLDPSSSGVMRDLIRAQREKGTTVILTTHNMADAAELCDRVAFIVDGSIRALDTPRALVMSRGAARVSYTWEEKGERNAVCPLTAMAADERLMEFIRSGSLSSIHSSEPDLNDIFIDVTGKALV